MKRDNNFLILTDEENDRLIWECNFIHEKTLGRVRGYGLILRSGKLLNELRSLGNIKDNDKKIGEFITDIYKSSSKLCNSLERLEKQLSFDLKKECKMIFVLRDFIAENFLDIISVFIEVCDNKLAPELVKEDEENIHSAVRCFYRLEEHEKFSFLERALFNQHISKIIDEGKEFLLKMRGYGFFLKVSVIRTSEEMKKRLEKQENKLQEIGEQLKEYMHRTKIITSMDMSLNDTITDEVSSDMPFIDNDLHSFLEEYAYLTILHRELSVIGQTLPEISNSKSRLKVEVGTSQSLPVYMLISQAITRVENYFNLAEVSYRPHN